MKNAAVIGATGLIGRALINELLSGTHYQTVHLLLRTVPDDLPRDPRLTIHRCDFSNEAWTSTWQADDVFCALGTTIKLAGSQQQFRAVDCDLVISAARAAQKNGAQHFLVVSAAGANANSTIFYNRVKGEMEIALMRLQLPRLSLFRPSLLTGPRQAFRPMEHIMKWFLLVAPLRWKPVSDRAVARAMVRVANEKPDHAPSLIVESDTIQRLARQP